MSLNNFLKKIALIAMLMTFGLDSSPVIAQQLRFQIILGNMDDVRRVCRQHNYSKYNIVNGTRCSDLRPKARKKPNPIVYEIQQHLNTLGYKAGKPDGFAGRKTALALSQFYLDRNMTYDGSPSDNELAELRFTVSNSASNNVKSAIEQDDPKTPLQKYKNLDDIRFEDIRAVTAKHLEFFR